MRICLLLSWCLILCEPFCLLGQSNIYVLEARPQIAHVSILAISTSVHQTYAGSQDVYLAQISFKNKVPQVAKLVDIYFLNKASIQRQLLVDRRLLSAKLTRDPECDVTGSAFFLANEASIFDADTHQILKDRAADIIPCYKIDHDATRLAKNN